MSNQRDNTLPQKCLECNAELTTPIVCEGCQTLYPLPKSVDFFALLGLERTYDLEPKSLDERFLSVSRHVHPDFFSGAGDQMMGLAQRLSAELNEAVKVLKDPVLRAGYLLEQSGGPSATADRTVPPEVLSDAMMLREEIEEAKAADDADTLRSVRETVTGKQAALLERIGALARKLPGATDEEKTQLRHTINSVKYYQNMLDLLWED